MFFQKALFDIPQLAQTILKHLEPQLVDVCVHPPPPDRQRQPVSHKHIHAVMKDL